MNGTTRRPPIISSTESVENALGIFRDPFAKQVDDRLDYGEERYTIIGMTHDRLLFVAFTMRDEIIRIIAARAAEPFENGAIMSKMVDKDVDWSRLDATSADQRHQAALSDPDAQPLSPDDVRRMARTSQVKIIRRALALSQEEFSARFHIPLGTLRDWEQGRKDPDAAARAYLTVIGRNPGAVTEALDSRP